MNHLSTTDLAKWQDAIFSSAAQPDLGEAKKWLPLCDFQQALCGPNNLGIRQQLIMDVLKPAMGHLAHADEQRDALLHNQYWREGYSYFEYTQRGADWYERVTGHKPWGATATREAYMDLVAPDGSIPLPEVAAGLGLTPSSKDYVATPSYIVKRWASGSYMLVGIDPDMEVRRNLHRHPEAGYVALMVGGKWLLRCKPYTGWNPGSVWNDDGLPSSYPKGAVLPTWRLKPPVIHVGTRPGEVHVTWENRRMMDRNRVIRWDAERVQIEDRWGLWGHKVREYKV